jgi:hypothetical protein
VYTAFALHSHSHTLFLPTPPTHWYQLPQRGPVPSFCSPIL